MDGETASESGLTLIKQLASCNNGSRGRALRVLLKTWLPTQLNLSDDHMKKLWKGLFYCMWHADKAPAQAQLIDRLSSLVPSLHLPLAIDYFSAFLLTMRREWSGIDALRLDKFYLLIRRFMASFFALMRNNSWDLELVKKLMGVLMEGSFFAEDKFPAKGVNYHIASVFLEELRPFMPVRKEVVDVVLVEFVRVMAKANDKVLVGKVKGSMFDVLLGMGRRLLEVRKLGEDVDSGDDVVVFGSVALCLGFSSRFHEMGESEECCQGNRKVLFGLDEEFLKLEKELAASGIEVLIPDAVRNDGDEEVPSLIPIVGGGMEVDGSEPGEVANGSAGKPLKKCKKREKDPGGADVKAEKKKKKKKKEKKQNGILDSDPEKSHTDRENENVDANGENPDNEQVTDGDEIKLDDYAISNLQMQFEKIAAEAGLDHDLPSACELPTATANGTVSKKRKRVKKADEVVEDGTKAKSGEKSAKKVKFSMKNNLVWKPQSPLPPQNLRLPPSATPRGSALKQGVPPGPVREMPPPTKKVKRLVKKTRKVVKRVKKLKSRSP
ncbi:ribosomal RNA processing protein 1 homolog A [Rosa chinensis]|uniref:ribosomal RNA processing protein 1 homolog A n=1 Tax=Rosa chinensis TaxID=74649 RepID=UPI000D092FC3|nr:ribosomal RNA processing protein 1 homolog A [Rosa chinensis]